MTCHRPTCFCGHTDFEETTFLGEKQYICQKCRASFDSLEGLSSCQGEIKKRYLNGKLIDCTCELCGASHGKDAADAHRITESLIGG